MSTQLVGVIGLGYVGLPLAVALGRSGVHVVGFDAKGGLADSLARGQSHIQDVADQELAEALERGLRLTQDPEGLRGCSSFVICVPTPLAESGHPDLSYVESAAATVARAAASGAVVILESTTYPGTTEEVVKPILERESGLEVGKDICLAFSPERIDPGNASFNVQNTPKVVGGYRDCCRSRAADVYRAIGATVVEAKGLREAEMAKLLENTYRHVNIALVNEMVKFCSELDIDLYDAIACAATKPFGFQAFYPGPGVGGHCIPIDPNYLSYRVRAELGYSFRFVELAQEINASMPGYVFTRIQQILNERGKSVRGSEILLLGVTYKADVADQRESPADPLARLCRASGALVSFADPYVSSWRVDGEAVPRVDLSDLPSNRFDVAVLLQGHGLFDDESVLSAGVALLDTRGRHSGESVFHL